MLTRIFLVAAGICLLAGIVLGIWAGLWAGITPGFGMFGLLACTAAALLLFAFVNSRVEAKFNVQ